MIFRSSIAVLSVGFASPGFGQTFGDFDCRMLAEDAYALATTRQEGNGRLVMDGRAIGIAEERYEGQDKHSYTSVLMRMVDELLEVPWGQTDDERLSYSIQYEDSVLHRCIAAQDRAYETRLKDHTLTPGRTFESFGAMIEEMMEDLD